MTQIVQTTITADDGSKIFFTQKHGKVHEGAAFFWIIHNKHGEVIGQSNRGFFAMCECKKNLKSVVAVVSLAAINNFQP